MKTSSWFICLLLYASFSWCQPVRSRLQNATEKLLADSQMKHAIMGFSVCNAQTGEKIFELNAQTGLAPASCQKIITSATAMELLGPDYRYTTTIGYRGNIEKHLLQGDLIIKGSGDPSLGSWRYADNSQEKVLEKWKGMIYQQGIYGVAGKYVAYLGNWEKSNIPGGWIWDDMGNYYGAGSGALNWHENQYDLVLASGNTVGDSVKIIETRPNLIQTNLVAELTSAAKGSGDNAYIYLAPMADKGFVRGTIPLAEQAFVISGSFPDPAMQLLGTLQALVENGLPHPPKYQYNYDKKPAAFETIGTIRSPTLDSLNYWFMKKSINLYGETFVKTMGLEKSGFGATETGLRVLKNFWKERGIEPASLHMIDGSGLSPQNRVSTDALIRVLQYARSRPWFNYYYDALPVYNKMKLKSGTIGGAKSFAGYHTAKDGTEYSLAIIVNNFDGSAAEMVKKMFLVLDELK